VLIFQLDLRKRLERRAKEYLCIVPQDRKFVNITTGDIITNSAKYVSEIPVLSVAEPEPVERQLLLDPKYLKSWSRNRKKIDRLRNTGNRHTGAAIPVLNRDLWYRYQFVNIV
jgi:hypothetical protein